MGLAFNILFFAILIIIVVVKCVGQSVGAGFRSLSRQEHVSCIVLANKAFAEKYVDKRLENKIEERLRADPYYKKEMMDEASALLRKCSAREYDNCTSIVLDPSRYVDVELFTKHYILAKHGKVTSECIIEEPYTYEEFYAQTKSEFILGNGSISDTAKRIDILGKAARELINILHDSYGCQASVIYRTTLMNFYQWEKLNYDNWHIYCPGQYWLTLDIEEYVPDKRKKDFYSYIMDHLKPMYIPYYNFKL